jgi:tetrahydromethanopterin S-methyltransferase subunit D
VVDRTYIPLGGAGTAAAPTTATVTCTTNQTSGNWLNRVITAVKVGSIN